MNVNEPRHGERRNVRRVTVAYGKPIKVMVPGGQEFDWPRPTVTTTAYEKYCERDGWQKVEGLFAGMMGCPKCGRDW